MSRPRIGAIPSLNALPLTGALTELSADEAEVRWDAPAALAEALHADELDLALVPQVEIARDPDYGVLLPWGIAARGAVQSILLFTESPWEQIERVAVDRASRSSVELLRVLSFLITEKIPEIELAPVEWTPGDFRRETLRDSSFDALLRIGDPALIESRNGDAPPFIDLGKEWRGQTDRPFVFAMWAGRKGRLSDPTVARAIALVEESAQRGVARRAEIAEEFATANPHVIDREAATTYLEQVLHYSLESDDLAAIEFFAALRRKIGSDVPADWRLSSLTEGTLL